LLLKDKMRVEGFSDCIPAIPGLKRLELFSSELLPPMIGQVWRARMEPEDFSKPLPRPPKEILPHTAVGAAC
jgi:hypothetical protein